jgi:hypothetical protein
MLRRVRPEPPRGFLELPLAPDTVPARGLVPGDRDVDETLVEVPLGRFCRPPNVLELLVRGEVLTATDQVEPGNELGHLLEPRRMGATFAAMATILLVGVDLFFRGKLEGLLAGHHLITVDSVEPPELVICDIARIEPEDVADAYPDIPILGYANHTDTDGLRRAHTAGFDQVIVKAALDERAKELIDELTAPVD